MGWQDEEVLKLTQLKLTNDYIVVCFDKFDLIEIPKSYFNGSRPNQYLTVVEMVLSGKTLKWLKGSRKL